jgi:hypothetical protein
VDEWLEEFWSDILSEEPLRIRAAWVMLEAEEQNAVRAHLMRMATETGWAEVRFLQAALRAISDDDGPTGRRQGMTARHPAESPTRPAMIRLNIGLECESTVQRRATGGSSHAKPNRTTAGQI